MFNKAAMLESKRTIDAAKQKMRQKEEEIILALPDDLPIAPAHVHGLGYKCDGSIKFECQPKLGEVPVIVNALTPIALVQVKDGTFTSFVPECQNVNTDNVELIDPIILVRDAYQETIRWYTMLGGYVVKVECEIPQGSYVRFERFGEVYHNGELLEFNYRVVADFPLEIVTKYARNDSNSYGQVVVAWHRREIEDSPIISILQTS